MVNAYCEVADVKEVLRIAQNYTDSDDELESCISSADAWVRGKLDLNNLTVPDPVPELIKQASMNYAAWFFRGKDPTADAQVFSDLGDEFIALYLAKNMVASPFFIGTDTS